MAKLLYMGRNSFRIVGAKGTVIYVDPYAGTDDDYSIPADIVLVTHQHFDHNKVEKVTKKPGCVVISNFEALEGGRYNNFDIKDIYIQPVEANNRNHSPKDCVGFIVTVEGIDMYFAGDTNETKAMSTFPDKKLEYAFLPCDGVYNMNYEAAAHCAEIIGAKRNVPVHSDPDGDYSMKNSIKFAEKAPNAVILRAGQEIEL